MKKKKHRGVACRRKKEENQKECLPEDMIFEILTWLPAEFLLNYGRKICQEWADLINNQAFIESHHSRSHTGLLIHMEYHEFWFLEVNKGKAILNFLTLNFPKSIVDFSESVMSSCRGITLFCLSKKNFSLCIANIVTKQIIVLPFAPLDPSDPIVAAIGYDYLHGEFKVICFYNAKDGSYYWLFFTVGKDEAWRKVDLVTSQIFIESLNERTWMSAGGVIYGVHRGSGDSRNIIAVDVDDETTWAVDVPDYKEETSTGFLVEKNMLMNITHGQKEGLISVYRLDEFRQSAWVKIYKFQINPSVCRLIKGCYSSLALADNGEVLIFQCNESFGVGIYNVWTGRYKFLGMEIPRSVPLCAISQSLIFL